MGNFNKKEYDILYTKNNRHPLNLGMSKEEYERFCAYCTKISENRTAYIKKLINIDAIKRGYGLIFLNLKDENNKTDI